MGLLRWLAPVLLALGVAWLIGGGGGACGREASPQLVQVLDMAPREVEVGERVNLLGEGFPPGKPAMVTFRGTLLRPGERPERGAEVVASGAVVGPEHVELGFTEVTEALFCGAGDRKAHTTFEGDVEVAFAAAAPGAPPIAGVLRHVTLDIRPGSTASDTEGDREGQRVLAWLGLEVTEGASGLAVDSVSPGSRSDAAGLLPGDVLASFDGVRVGSTADVVPAPGERDALVGVRRGGEALELMKTVTVDGFRRAPPAELLGAALIALAALAIVLLFAAPLPRGLAARLQRIIARLRASHPGSRRRAHASSWERLVSSFSEAAREALPPAGAPAMVDALVCALLAAMPFGQYLIAAQLDVGLLFVAAATALVTAALIAGSSPWAGLRGAIHVAWQHLPGGAAVASVVLMTGSLRVQELEHAQGGWPWDWLAFRSPAALVALVLLLACARIEPEAPERASGLRARIEALGAEERTPRGPWLEAACRAHRLVVAGLASTLFLGAWVLPGLSPAAQDARPSLELAGAAWLLVKTWGVVALVAGSRTALPQRRLTERSRRTALALVPLSLGVLAASAAWTWWSPVGPAQLLVSGTLVGAVVLVALALAHRLRYGLDAPGHEGHISPFL
jgi:NADH-quinone oxidoreductase subunit H